MTELEVSAVPGFYQRYNGETNKMFDYTKEPYCDISVVGRCDWLPEHVRQATRWPMKWAHAMCWAERLQSLAGGYMPENREENKQVQEVIEVASWTMYWAYEGFGIRGRRTGDQKDRLRP